LIRVRRRDYRSRTVIDTERILEAANTDREFRIAARFWSTVIRIEFGARAYTLEVRDGSIRRFAPASDDDAHEVRIAAPEDAWAKFLEPVPQPFFHDLSAAVMREGFVLEGDLMWFWPYYPAVRRMFDVMRALGAASSRGSANAAHR
jgi:hypothetical protein